MGEWVYSNVWQCGGGGIKMRVDERWGKLRVEKRDNDVEGEWMKMAICTEIKGADGDISRKRVN